MEAKEELDFAGADDGAGALHGGLDAIHVSQPEQQWRRRGHDQRHGGGQRRGHQHHDGQPGHDQRADRPGINATLNTASAGAYSGTITTDNQAADSAAASQGSDNGDATIGVSGTVLADRVITASTVSLGTVHIGASVNGETTFITTGDDDNKTRISVANGSVTDFRVTGGSNPVFNAAAVTDARTLNATLNTAGIFTAATALTLTPGTESAVSGTQTPVGVRATILAS